MCKVNAALLFMFASVCVCECVVLCCVVLCCVVLCCVVLWCVCGVLWCVVLCCECKMIYRTEVQYLVMGFVQIANCDSK